MRTGDTEKTFGFHEKHISITEDDLIITTATLVTTKNLIFHETLTLLLVASGLVNRTEFMGIVQLNAINIDRHTILIKLRTGNPTILVTLVVNIVSLDKLGMRTTTGGSPSIEAPCGASGITHPEIGIIVAGSIFLLVWDSENHLR